MERELVKPQMYWRFLCSVEINMFKVLHWTPHSFLQLITWSALCRPNRLPPTTEHARVLLCVEVYNATEMQLWTWTTNHKWGGVGLKRFGFHLACCSILPNDQRFSSACGLLANQVVQVTCCSTGALFQTVQMACQPDPRQNLTLTWWCCCCLQVQIQRT